MKRRLSLLVFFVFILISASAQQVQYPFSRININAGLSHYQVSSILKDAKGFMWFGTATGLNRYDGYKFKVFKHIQGDSTSIDDNYIVSIEEGPGNKLWVQTHIGFNIYDPLKESFDSNPETFLKSIGVKGILTVIKRGRNGNFWIVTDTGIYSYSAKSKKAILLRSGAADRNLISPGQITSVAENESGNLWIVHANGLLEQLHPVTKRVIYRTKITAKSSGISGFRIFVDKENKVWAYLSENAQGIYYVDPEKKSVEHFSTAGGKIRLNANLVRSVVQDDKGTIWVGTDHGGINLIDKTNWTIRYLTNSPDDDKSLSQNSVNVIYKDIAGVIWIGTFKQGISYYHPDISKFPVFRHLVSKLSSLPFEDINAFAEDKKGNLWIGTNGGGLIYFDRVSNSYKQYKHNNNDPNSLANNVIVSMFLDHEQKLWIGTYLGGLDCFDGQRFIHFKHNSSDPSSISDDSIWEIMEDSNNNLWIGTFSNGLDLFDRSEKIFRHFPAYAPNSVQAYYISAMIEDKAGNIWVGTANGIDVLEKPSNIFAHYQHSETNPKSLTNNNVLSLLQDSRGLIWVGTWEGITIFNQKREIVKLLGTKDGLTDNTAIAILEDQDGDIWVSTPNGLSNITLKKAEKGDYKFYFRNYNEADGLQGRAFNENAALKTRKGELVFGGISGFNLFNPAEIKINNTPPKLVFTDFELFNNSLSIGQKVDGKTVLHHSITATNEIELNYDQNIFSIEFAALNFINPEKNGYAYFLEGFSDKWLTTDGKVRKATFTNLDPGEYTFKVKASNGAGSWNKEAIALKITILPPFWQTPLAYVLYALSILGILLYIRNRGIRKLRDEFAIEQERQDARRTHELDLMKIKFFTNVSHEFRTPLSLILSPLERIIYQTKDVGQKSQLQLVQRNAKRLLNLVNQLLDFRKMEVQELKLQPVKADIIQFVKECFYSFTDLAEKKNIKFEYSSNIHSFHALFDHDKIDRILFNLLSNAFKFTPEGGMISLDLILKISDNQTAILRFKICDTGIGIEKDKQDKIFDRFFQNEMPGSIVNQGSGIGLAITKEFISLHGGNIQVESEPGQGSCFVIEIPLQNADHLTELSFNGTSLHEAGSMNGFEKNDWNPKKQTLLLIEDNEDFRFYLKDNLKQYYNISEAQNGKAGWSKLLSTHPDLVISDISMPEMDGIELCNKIRSDARTNHIPVILLTALAGEDQQLKGLETGANDYISKPFNFEILLSKIRNLLDQHRSMKKTYQKRVEAKPVDLQIASIDEKFIQNALQILEKNISNSEFTVEDLSRDLNMSRVALYKKMMGLTGKSPIEFIRSFRLKRAAQLLEESQLTVSEIAFKIGINNPKYFAKYFKAEFGLLPSAYASQKRMEKKTTEKDSVEI
ncbi:hybrid sensor histidine kinase/response regulator transcription factor [Rubrolithibacter danxiaensis]|uniref:hybrid sensor histidine kinase/response regulator transcription factor n=1 Tax=Rubrolithibacter danxiaensis TaxID=3390805 RepID=UPI003BF874B6